MAKTEIRVLACNKWPSILEQSGIDKAYLTRAHGPCPVCGGRDRFRFDDKEGRGTFFCSNCRAGDGFRLLELVHGWDFKQAAQWLREEYFQNSPALQVVTPPRVKAPEEDPARIKANLLRTWKRAKRVTPGDPVWLYLTNERGLPLTHIPRYIRFHPGLPYYSEDKDRKKVGTFPVMLTAVIAGDGHAVGLHRTYLTSDGKKAPVPKPKKLMKTCGVQGGAIRLARAGKKLCIAEGIETAFAVMAITKLPCWATVSATLMPQVVIPPDVEEILIFADNDCPDEKGRRAGQEAAAALKQRLEAEGRKVKVTIPLLPGTDFHDIFCEREQQKVQRQQRRTRPAAAKAVA